MKGIHVSSAEKRREHVCVRNLLPYSSNALSCHPLFVYSGSTDGLARYHDEAVFVGAQNSRKRCGQTVLLLRLRASDGVGIDISGRINQGKDYRTMDARLFWLLCSGVLLLFKSGGAMCLCMQYTQKPVWTKTMSEFHLLLALHLP